LGVQELTRVGMGATQMEEVAHLYARVLLKGDDTTSVKADVTALKSEFQTIRYCFNEDSVSGYPL